MDSPPRNDSPALSVGLVSPGWPPEAIANGIASYTGTLVQGLAKLGARYHVLTLRPMSGRIDPFVHIVRPNVDSFWSKVRRRLNPEAWPQKTFCVALGQEIQRLRATHELDLVEMEESYGWAAMLPKIVPTVVRLHGPWFLNGAANGAANDSSFRWRDRMEAKGLVAATAVTAPSADVLKRTREHFGLALPKAAVIPNPVSPVAPEDQWRLPEADHNRITFIGRFDRHKGGDTILDAFAKVLQTLPEARLDFVGPDRGCTGPDGRMSSFAQYLHASLPPPDRQKVLFYGFLPGSKAAQLRKRALVTVVPSRYETFGITAAEAMMAGCPLVVSGAGALTELVQDGLNGLVSRPGDADDLAEKILSMLKNPDRAARLGAQAAADALERYDPVVVAKQTLEFYRTVVGHSRPAND
jgi:glycosyltransferase involved in cell wall biosynthesis